MKAILQAPASHNAEPVSSGTKAWYMLTMGLLVCVPYFWLERHLAFPSTQILSSTLDRELPFVPLTGWLYLSLYIQLAIPLALVCDVQRLRQMVFGFAWIAVVSHTLFFFWPTSVSPFAARTSNLPMRLIITADTYGNALPSLHASLSVYCALCLAVLLKSRRLKVPLWTWTLLILASTLLAKRHEFVDILAGAVLGGAVYWALFRRRPNEAVECDAWQNTVEERKCLSRGIEAELAPLLRLDWHKRALELACFAAIAWAGISVTLYGRASSQNVLLVAGIVLTAIALNAFVLLMHDGMHFTLFRDRRWNWLGSVLLGSTFGMSFTAYRILHTRHHRFLGDTRDPDDYQNYVSRRPVLWSLHFMRLTVGPLLYLALIPLLALKYGSDQERRRLLGEYAFLLAVYSALFRFVPAPTLLLVWLVPLLIVGSFTAVRGFTQHGIADATDPLLASRTVFPSPIIGFLLLHENYHLEHHLFPEVPSYHLPRLHRLIWRRLPRAVSSRGYLSFLVQFLRAVPALDETPIGIEHPAERQG